MAAPCRSSRRRPPWQLPARRRRRRATASSASAPTSSPARCSPPTAPGLFPMPVGRGGPIGWWSPDPAGVLPLDGLRVSPLAAPVVRAATRSASTPRSTTVMRALRRPAPAAAAGSPTDVRRGLRARCTSSAGPTASRRGRDDGELVGGLYGVAIGGLFAGESMFHRATDASKVALVGLVERLRGDAAAALLDVQWATPHLALARRDRDPATRVPRVAARRGASRLAVADARWRASDDGAVTSGVTEPRPAVADADVLGPLHGARRRTSCTARTWPRARPACRSPSTCRPRPATTPTTPMARGEVGKVGVPVAHLGHMRTLLDGIPPGEMNTSMTINATAAWLLGALRRQRRGAGRRRRARCAARRRTTSSRSTCRAARTSSRPSRRRRLIVDMIAWCAEHVPKWNPMNVCTTTCRRRARRRCRRSRTRWPPRSACSTRCATRARSPPSGSPQVFGSISFFVNAGIRFVEEICKMRAFTELWDRIGLERYGVTDAEGCAASATACR